MKEIMFGIENRHLLKLGWQRCIAGALESQGFGPEDIPKDAKLLHRPIPNQAKTVFFIFVPKEGKQDPVLQTGKIRNFFEFMNHARDNLDNSGVQSTPNVENATGHSEVISTGLEGDSGGRPLIDTSGISIH